MQPSDFVLQLRNLEEMALRVIEAAFALILYFRHQVRGMALVARHPVGHVGGVLEKLLLLAADVAEHTASCVLFRVRAKVEDRKQLQSGSDFGVNTEGEDGMFFQSVLGFAFVALGRLDGVSVRFAGPVTGFTA